MKNEVFYMLCSYCEDLDVANEILGVFTSVNLAKESATRLPALGGNRQVMIVELPVNEDIALCGMSDADLLQYPIHYLT